jgi:hypothetical protein
MNAYRGMLSFTAPMQVMDSRVDHVSATEENPESMRAMWDP